MTKIFKILLILITVISVTGCSGVTTPAPQKKAKGQQSEKTFSDYWAFYNAKDPCANGRKCNIAEKSAYFRLAQEAAKRAGMVPLDPKYGRPALECPIEVIQGPDYKCPDGTCSPLLSGCSSYETEDGEEEQTCAVEPQQPVQHSQTGFLLTAFDTDSGTKFVILKAEEQFEPEVRFEDVAGNYESVAQTIAAGEGNVAVYLTAFPLVETELTAKSRIPNDFDVKHIRVIAEKMGKKGRLVFRKWN